MSDIYKRLLARNDELGDNEEFNPDEMANLSPGERRAQYQKLLAEASAKFKAEYGFPHECSCAVDYALGNVEYVPNCFLEMVDEAMKRIAIYYKFQQTVEGILNSDKSQPDGELYMEQLGDEYRAFVAKLAEVSGADLS